MESNMTQIFSTLNAPIRNDAVLAARAGVAEGDIATAARAAVEAELYLDSGYQQAWQRSQRLAKEKETLQNALADLEARLSAFVYSGPAFFSLAVRCGIMLLIAGGLAYFLSIITIAFTDYAWWAGIAITAGAVIYQDMISESDHPLVRSIQKFAMPVLASVFLVGLGIHAGVNLWLAFTAAGFLFTVLYSFHREFRFLARNMGLAFQYSYLHKQKQNLQKKLTRISIELEEAIAACLYTETKFEKQQKALQAKVIIDYTFGAATQQCL